MKKYKIFISGVQKELKEERQAIKKFIRQDVLLSEYFDVFLFEDSPAKSNSSEKAYLEEVGKSDIYISLLGSKYGSAGEGKVSPIEVEFREAKKKHKVILIYIKGKNGEKDKEREEGIQKLIKEIKDPKAGYSYRRFKDASELTRLVYESLIEFLKAEGIVGRGAFDERICQEATFKDIDEDKVRWFLKVARAARKYPLKQNTPIEALFTHLDLMKNSKLTNAAIVLFGKNPHHFFLQAEVKCLQFSGTEVKKPFINYQVYNGNLFEQVDKALAFVLDAIKFPVIQESGSARFRRPFEIPEFAIQEAIVNAVAHRNYNVTSGVQVMVFSDRVEVWNSGSLPPELSIEDLKKPHTSFPANPLIANALYLADYAQRAGSGTLEMIEQCRAQGAPEPEFVLIRNVEFRTILARDIYTETFFEQSGLNNRQRRAVRLTKEKGAISLSDLQNAFPDINRRTLYRDLQALVDKGILKAQGERKGRRYSL